VGYGLLEGDFAVMGGIFGDPIFEPLGLGVVVHHLVPAQRRRH